jgi:hypothetical protein
MLIQTPRVHPTAALTNQCLPSPGIAFGAWSGWYSVAEMLDAGDLPLPDAEGVYLFRLSPSLGMVPQVSPTRLLHIGGMDEDGTISNRVQTFIAASMGTGDSQYRQAPSAGGIAFGCLRRTWGITIRDVDVCFMKAPTTHRAFCSEVETWCWYWSTWKPANVDQYPACDERARWKCGCGHSRNRAAQRAAHAAWYTPPPNP